MQKRCILFDPTVLVGESQSLIQIDWGMCMLCQQWSWEPLIFPSYSMGKDEDARYDSLGAILMWFSKLDELPFYLLLFDLNKGEWVSE